MQARFSILKRLSLNFLQMHLRRLPCAALKMQALDHLLASLLQDLRLLDYLDRALLGFAVHLILMLQNYRQ